MTLYEQQMKWDKRFLELARNVSTWSKDPSTQVGAIIVAPNKTVVSLGYNGFPRMMPDLEDYLNNREEKYSRIIHAEVNALIQAARPLTGCTLYTYPFMPCDRCAVQMVQAGIMRIVFPPATPAQEERWGSAFKQTRKILTECKVRFQTCYLD